MGRHIKGVRIVGGVLEIPDHVEEAPPLVAPEPPLDDAIWLRVLENLVPEFVQLRGIGRSTCATCGSTMHRMPTPTRAASAQRRHIYAGRYTRGHLIPTTQKSTRARAWIPQCGQCNSDQSDMTLYAWLHRLAERRDPRAPLVEEVLLTLIEMGVHPIDVCGSRAQSWGDGGVIDGWLGRLDSPGGTGVGAPDSQACCSAEPGE